MKKMLIGCILAVSISIFNNVNIFSRQLELNLQKLEGQKKSNVQSKKAGSRRSRWRDTSYKRKVFRNSRKGKIILKCKENRFYKAQYQELAKIWTGIKELEADMKNRKK